MCVGLFLSCGDFPTDPAQSALSNHWPDYGNNDSSGCVLQDCCIVLTGKPLLLLLAVAVQRKECGQPEISHKITAHFQASAFSSGPIVPETICGLLEKESVATKYAEYFKRIVCMTTNYDLLI